MSLTYVAGGHLVDGAVKLMRHSESLHHYISEEFYNILNLPPNYDPKTYCEYWNIILDYCKHHNLRKTRDYRISKCEVRGEFLGDSIRLNTTLDKLLNITNKLEPASNILQERFGVIYRDRNYHFLTINKNGSLTTYIKLKNFKIREYSEILKFHIITQDEWIERQERKREKEIQEIEKIRRENELRKNKERREIEKQKRKKEIQELQEKQELEKKKREEETRIEYEFLVLFEEIKKNKMNSLEKFKQFKEMSVITSPKQMIEYMTKIPPLCPDPIFEPPLLPLSDL